MSVTNFSKIVNRINEANNYGQKEIWNFFHLNALHKFFATQLTKTGLEFLKIQ